MVRHSILVSPSLQTRYWRTNRATSLQPTRSVINSTAVVVRGGATFWNLGGGGVKWASKGQLEKPRCDWFWPINTAMLSYPSKLGSAPTVQLFSARRLPSPPVAPPLLVVITQRVSHHGYNGRHDCRRLTVPAALVLAGRRTQR